MFQIKLSLVLLILVFCDFLIVSPSNVTESGITTLDQFIKDYVESEFKYDNESDVEKNSTVGNRHGRAYSWGLIGGFLDCVRPIDVSCLLDRSQDALDRANKNLLLQADSEARRIARSRSESVKIEESPSSLIKSITNLLIQIPGLLTEGIGSLLRSGELGNEYLNDEVENIEKEYVQDNLEEEEQEDEEEYNEEDEVIINQTEASVETRSTTNNCDVMDNKSCLETSKSDQRTIEESNDEVSRKKKKKIKKKTIIKLLLIGAVLYAKLAMLLKIIAVKVKVKFLLIALATLLLNITRFWWELKSGHHPQKVIYYEHAQHQHHYDGADDWDGGHGGGWARAHSEAEKLSAQDLAYSKRLPYGVKFDKVDDKPNISWDTWG